MRINKYYYLKQNGYSSVFYYSCTRELYDSATIVHYNYKGFKPIVLIKNRVISFGEWKPSVFYKFVCAILRGDSFYVNHFGIYKVYRLNEKTVRWGCRKFKYSQLRTIKKAMEYHYGKENLR